MVKRLKNEKQIIFAIAGFVLAIIIFLLCYDPFKPLYSNLTQIENDFTNIGDFESKNLKYDKENKTFKLVSTDGVLSFKVNEENEVIKSSIVEGHTPLFVPRMIIYSIIIGIFGMALSVPIYILLELVYTHGNFRKEELMY